MKVLRALVVLLPMCLINTGVVRAATAGGVGTEDECEAEVSVKKVRDKGVGKISCKGNKGE